MLEQCRRPIVSCASQKCGSTHKATTRTASCCAARFTSRASQAVDASISRRYWLRPFVKTAYVCVYVCPSVTLRL